MRYKELLWREYFVQVHYRKGDNILSDMEEDKTAITKNNVLPKQIQDKTFDSSWINNAIIELENSWYLHNHMRMRLASYMVHRQKLHRKKCADRTYYHFIDGELWSNHLSRQRVQSTFSHKPYFMNEENLQRYGNISDPLYRWSYENISQKIFDPQRITQTHNSSDIYQTLKTDTSELTSAQSDYSWYTILTPRDLHPDKITTPQKTVCILDKHFLQRHPRSQKRIDFVKAYCDLYKVHLVYGDIKNIVSTAKHITIYQTRNPYYRQAFESIATREDVEYHIHKRCSPAVQKWYTKKFFPFREKTKNIF